MYAAKHGQDTIHGAAEGKIAAFLDLEGPFGYSESRIRKILGLDWLRVIKEVTDR